MDVQDILAKFNIRKPQKKFLFHDSDIEDQQKLLDLYNKIGLSQDVTAPQQEKLNEMLLNKQPYNPLTLEDIGKTQSGIPLVDVPASEYSKSTQDFLRNQSKQPIPSSTSSHGVSGSWDLPTSPLLPSNNLPLPTPKISPSTITPVSPTSTTMSEAGSISPSDQEKRDAFEKSQKSPNWGGILAQALAGAGDVITAGGAPYGTKPTRALETVTTNIEKQKEGAKKTFEAKFTTDPKSDMSKLAQSAVARLLGKPVEDYKNFSVEQIDKTFPIWKEALNNEQTKELKQLQIDYLKQNKQAITSSINEGRQQKSAERQADDFYKVGKDLTNDYRYKEMGKQQMGLTSVRQLVNEVKSGNTVASAAIGAKLARAMGEVGVLTEEDVKRYQRSGWLPQQLADKATKLVKGKPTDWTLNEINQIADGIESAFEANRKPIQEDYVKRLARSYNISEEEAAYKLNVPYKPEASKKNEKSVQNNKNIVRQQYSEAANKTKLFYSDGSEEIVEGKR